MGKLSSGLATSAAPIYVEGQAGELSVDLAGNLRTSSPISSLPTYAYSVSQSSALEASRVIKASAGNVFKITGRLDSTASADTYYVQLLNSATLPADGAVTHLMTPIKIVHDGLNDFGFDMDFTYAGIHGTSGLVLVVSTTEFTKTIAGSIMSATVLYK